MKEARGAQILVVGLGTMGRGIARVFDHAGASVRVVDVDDERTKSGMRRLDEEVAVDGGSHGISPANGLAAGAADADWIIEAIIEDLDEKRAFLSRLSAIAPSRTVIASNTSSLPISELGASLDRPERFLGMHFFNPATKLDLVEVVQGAETEQAVAAATCELVRSLGKTPILCRDSPGFVVNRVIRPLYYEAELLVMEGVEPAAVDAVAREALGHRMGPLETADLAGLHVHLASSETALREFGDPRYRPIPIVRSLVRAGHTGRGARRGFYDYDAEHPRVARERITEVPTSARRCTVRPSGPWAHRLPLPGPGANEGTTVVTVYACGSAATDEDVAAVRDLDSEGPVVVDSSDGRWLDDLPQGAGWVRVHAGVRGPFAEVVADRIAGIDPPSFMPDVLDALQARRVRVLPLPGLVGDRLLQSLINEAAFVVEQGTATPADIDLALRLGMNHSRGPFDALRDVGVDSVVAGLRALQRGTGDPRYRPAQYLRRMARGNRWRME